VGHVACVGEKRSARRFWTEKPKGKKTIGIPKSRWDGNITFNLTEIGREGTCTGFSWFGIRPSGGLL
jgi:hypothetical protein